MSELRELHSIALAEKTQELGSVEAAHQSEVERLQMEFEAKLREVGKNKAQNERSWRNKMREAEDQMARERRTELEKLESNSHQERMQMMESQRIAVSGKLLHKIVLSLTIIYFSIISVIISIQ